MTRIMDGGLGAAIAVLLASVASAQDRPTPPDASRQSPATQSPSKPPDHGVAVQLLRDVGSDYKNFFSTDTALWLGIGGGAALGVHAADKSIAESVQESHPSLPGGSIYGTQKLQIPVAIGWWIAGAAAGSERNADTGRDLLRAQIATFSWTYAIKLATQRTRPNGDPHSFPSGHASTSFATAMVSVAPLPVRRGGGVLVTASRDRS